MFEEAKNILSIEYTEDHTGRYRKYQGKKTIHTDIIDWINSDKKKKSSQPIKDTLIEDTGIQRQRSLLLVSEEPEFECRQQKDIRKAKSKFVSLTTIGFHQKNKLFDVGKTAKIVSPSLGIDEKMIINNVTFNVSRSEKKVTKIELVSEIPIAKKPIKQQKEKEKEWIKN